MMSKHQLAFTERLTALRDKLHAIRSLKQEIKARQIDADADTIAQARKLASTANEIGAAEMVETELKRQISELIDSRADELQVEYNVKAVLLRADELAALEKVTALVKPLEVAIDELCHVHDETAMAAKRALAPRVEERPAHGLPPLTSNLEESLSEAASIIERLQDCLATLQDVHHELREAQELHDADLAF